VNVPFTTIKEAIMQTDHKVLMVALIISNFLIFSVAMAGPTMPKDLATEFTQYPGSSVMHTTTSAPLVQAILDCGSAEIDTVYNYYKGKATQNGWQVHRESKSAGIYNLALRKNDNSAMILISRANGATSATLNIMSR
jgi:hypothetical protein